LNLIESMSADVDNGDKSVILLPVGSLEQHGSQAPLGCDGIIAEHLCIRAGEITGCAVLPALFYGYSHCHTAFPGTFSLEEKTYIALLGDIISEAARNGFRNLVFLSGHGGNRAAAEAAITQCNLPVNVEYLGYWQLPGVSDEEELLFGKTGHHITTSEVSMVWYLLGKPVPETFNGKYPGAVNNISSLSPEEWRKLYPDGGVGGDMTRVSVKKGRTLFNFASDKLAQIVRLTK